MCLAEAHIKKTSITFCERYPKKKIKAPYPNSALIHLNMDFDQEIILNGEIIELDVQRPTSSKRDRSVSTEPRD